MLAQVHFPQSLSGEELDRYLAEGWFRMGQTIFTTNFLNFKQKFYSAIWLRIRLDECLRSTTEEKNLQVNQIQLLKQQFASEQSAAIQQLKKAARSGGNVFEELMEAGKYCTLGMISEALYDVGGAYRRSM